MKKPKKLRNRILAQKSKTKFECRNITNPMELMKMGYTPSKKIVPTNNVEINELIKKIA